MNIQLNMINVVVIYLLNFFFLYRNDVSQSSKLVSGPPRRKMAPNLSLSKPHYSPASTEMDSETTGPQSTSPHRRTLSPRNLATSVKSIRPKVSINTDETLPSTASVPVKADGRVAINTDGTLPSTVKADGKAPHRPRGRQRPAAVPRQSRVNHSEDIQSHAQQQPDINSFNKGKEQGESNSEEEIALKETTSPQSDPFSCMQSLKDSEVSKPRSSSEQDPTPTPEKASYKQTNKSLSAMRGLNDPADLIRLGKAQKLREMLKLEVCKERVSSVSSLLKVRCVGDFHCFIHSLFKSLRLTHWSPGLMHFGDF